MSADPLIRSTFAGFRIIELLGRGGMGVVYRAHDERLGRNVALKIIAPELAENAAFRGRFVRESQMAASIDHPNVIPIYAAGEADGSLYIAMRYVPGSDLKALLKNEGALDPKRALEIVSQMAAALDAAHARGLVHRDVKPANALLTSSDHPGARDHVYLTDFGLSKGLSSESDAVTTGQFAGTTEYVAPEQIEGRPLDGRADLYSLGCVLYECLTGKVVFGKETVVAVMYAHLTEEPPAVTRIRPELPEEMDRVLAKAMAKRPQDRYDSCGEFLAAAQSALTPGSGLATGSPLVSIPESTPAVITPPVAPEVASQPPAKAGHPRRWVRKPLIWGAISVLVIASLIAFIVVAPRHGTGGVKGIDNIWLVDDGATGTARQLTFGTFGFGGPSWSPDGSQLAFSGSSTGAARHIFVMLVSTGRVVQLTFGPFVDRHPAWSPDGTHIAFDRTAPGFGELPDIYIMASDGTAITPITLTPSAESHPTWSPAGDQIAFAADTVGYQHIYIASADGRGPVRQLTRSSNDDADPVWSRTGVIAFTRVNGDNQDIWVIDPHGGGARDVTAGTSRTQELNPAWSPDGMHLAFASNRADPHPDTCRQCNYDIYVTAPDGTGIRVISRDPALDVSPTWSAAHVIAFVSHREAKPKPHWPLLRPLPSTLSSTGPGVPSNSCLYGWISPVPESAAWSKALQFVETEMSLRSANRLVVREMRYFEGPDIGSSTQQDLQVRLWYIKAALPSDPSFRARWLVKMGVEGISVAAVAPYGTTGYRSPDWVGFRGSGTARAYPGLPGKWSGQRYDFAAAGLSPQLSGCMAGT